MRRERKGGGVKEEGQRVEGRRRERKGGGVKEEGQRVEGRREEKRRVEHEL